MKKIKITLIGFIYLVLAYGQSVDWSRQNAITKAIESTSPAVASINVTQIQQYSINPWYEQFQRDPLFSLLFPSETRLREVKSSGSGVVISQDGYVITNYHVVENALKIIATLPGGKQYSAEIIGLDRLTDLALLKLEGENFNYVKIGNSDNVIIGEWVIALGNPFGLFGASQQPIATLGILSGKNLNFGKQGNHVFQNMIQTDAAINPGNSGGPLVNAEGEVIGINTFVYSVDRSQQGSSGFGFAIPINRALNIVKELKSGIIVRKSKLGLRGQDLDPRTAELLGINVNSGVLITQIAPNSSASKAKLKYGDVIIELEGEKVRTRREFAEIIEVLDLRPGDRILIKIFRNGRILKKYLTLETY